MTNTPKWEEVFKIEIQLEGEKITDFKRRLAKKYHTTFGNIASKYLRHVTNKNHPKKFAHG